MTRKALLCGINSYANAPLKGCVNDAHNVRDLLVNNFGFRPEEIRLLEDEQVVKAELLRQWEWLTSGATPGDVLVFHFSGHGSYVPDESGEELDLRDEITCLQDMDFNDPATYLTDDEWYELARGVDPAVQLIILKDTCHSGGSARFIGVRSADGQERVVLANNPAELKGRRSSDPPPESSLSNTRFLVPPHAPARAWRGEVGSTHPTRLAEVPQTSLMACKEDQTAADAPIDGDFHGAFTYHLCQVLRANGDLGSTEAIESVAQQLQGRFEQVPQHEGRDVAAPIFGEAGDFPIPADSSPTGDGSLTAQEMVYRAHMKFLDTMAALEGVSVPERGLRSSGRVLVTVHGIGNHSHGYSNSWWQALAPHVGATFTPSNLGLGRREVLWSDLVNRSRSLQRSLPAEEVNALRQSILDVIDDRRSHEAARSGRLDQLPVARGGAIAIDDFLVYMLDDGMRRRILERFTKVVGPLLAAGTRIDLISHSWGTVVAYEGLRELEQRALSGRVANWFTAGSALSMAPVQGRLRPENRPARGRRAPAPALVDAWINLDAKGDLVGGPLGSRFPVNREYLELDPIPCSRQFWGGYEIGCAHGSYFQTSNLKVNRDIFAAHILGTARDLGPEPSGASRSAGAYSITISSNGSAADPAVVSASP
jgi:hypothetical protein